MSTIPVRVALLVLLAGIACVAGAQIVDPAVGRDAAAPVSREDVLKAAYLFNFTKFVEWPGESGDMVLTLCFIGGSAVREAMAGNLANKRIGNHTIYVREVTTPQDPGNCNVLYMETTDGHAVPPIAVLHAPVLTVSNGKGFAHRGGIIELFAEGNRLRFIVNMANAKRAGIKISSSLLQLASVLEKDSEP